MVFMRHPNGTSLLRAPSGIAGSVDCCCDTEVPTECAGGQLRAGCFTDLYSLYPDHPGDDAALDTYFSGYQFDWDPAGTFTAQCASGTCNLFNSGPVTLTYNTSGHLWEAGGTCTGENGSGYTWTITFFFNCAGDTCQAISNFGWCRTSGCGSNNMLVSWLKNFSIRPVFTTFSESLPVYAPSTGSVGVPACFYSGSNLSISVH